MQVQNFQQTAWSDLFNRVIDILAKNAEFTHVSDTNDSNGVINVKFDIPDETKNTFLNIEAVSNQSETSSEKLKVRITVSYRGVKASQIIDLIELPRLANGGLLVKGSRWSLINTTHPASGWYIEEIKDHPGVYALTLHRGAGKVISIQPKKISKAKKDEGYTFVVHTKTTRKETVISLAEFLYALAGDATMTFDSLAERCGLDDCKTFADTFNKFKTEKPETLKDICTRTYCRLRGKSEKYVPLDSVVELQNIFNKNYLNIGLERIPRFKKFTSFNRAVGAILNETIELEPQDRKHLDPFAQTTDDTKVFRRGTVITESIARKLDSIPTLAEINIISTINDKREHFILRRPLELTEAITFEEICCALRVYDQVFRGLGTADDIDDTCNKVLHSIREEFSKYIERAFYKCTSAIERTVNKQKGNYNETQLIADLIQKAIAARTTEDSVAKMIRESSCYQQVDETNSLASFDQSYRITSTASNVTVKARDIHPLQYGRICPYTTSESKQVGLNLDMTVGCDIDDYGFCTTPVFEVDVTKPKDSRIGKQIQLSAVDELDTVIAPVDADLTGDVDTLIYGCRVNGEFMTMPLREVTHIMSNNLQTIGPLIASVPAQNMDAGKRSVMSVSAQRQALIPWRCERPHVTTGLDAICDIGVKRAKDVVKEYIHSNRQALIDFKDVGEQLPDRLYISSSSHDNAKLVIKFAIVLNNKTHQFVNTLKPPKATIKGSLNYTRFNTPRVDGDSRYFDMNDIVFYNSDIDMSNADISTDKVNFGGVMNNIDAEELKSHGVAIGVNVNVMFKSMNGYTYEDSIVVNEDFLARQGLAIIKTHTLSYEISKGNQIDDSYSNGHILNGKPMPGYYVQPGQNILAVCNKEKNNAWCYPLAVGKQGYIISTDVKTSRNGNQTVIIHLGDILPIGVGDKLTGLHGNKGVIGRIMKSSEMDFTADGLVPDVILNPLGVLARLNMGQMVEFTLGAISRKTGKIEVLEPFSDKVNIHDILERSKELGLVEQDVYSGTSGLKLDGKALVGSMYFLRVEHTSTSKYNATGDCHENISVRTKQPMRCAGGAQRVSEMGTWCLLSMDATNLLDSLFSVQSDSENKKAFDKALTNGRNVVSDSDNLSQADIAKELTNNNIDLVRAYFYMLGLNIDICQYQDSEIQSSVRFLTQSDLNDRVSIGNGKLREIDTTDLASSALHNPEVFGTSETDYAKLMKCYGKLQFKTEVIMPALLHTNNLPQLIRAIVFVPGEDTDYEVKFKSLNKDLIESIINCGHTKQSYIFKGWSKEIIVAKDRICELKELGIDIPDNLSGLRVPILVKVHSKEDIANISSVHINRFVDSSVEVRYNTGMLAVVDIFKNYNLYTSLFDLNFRDINSYDIEVSASADDITEVDTNDNDDITGKDKVSEDESAVFSIEDAFNEKQSVEEELDSTVDDDKETFITEADVRDEEVGNLDSATIEEAIPSFRGIVMMLASYPNQDGRVLSNFVVDGMLIPPAKFRPIMQSDTEKNSPIDVCLNAIYNRVKGMSGSLNNNAYATQLYNTIKVQEITGTDKKAPPILNQLKDHKSGTSILRDTNLSKRVTYSGRSVISIGRDLQFGECGVPVCMLTTIFMGMLKPFFSEKFFGNNGKSKSVTEKALVCLANKNIIGFRQVFVRSGVSEFDSTLGNISPERFSDFYRMLVTKLEELLEEQPGVLNREPSLHKFSTQGFKVKPTDSYTIQLHPLNCHGFNADFDGDQMAAFFPMHLAGREDTKSKVMARNNLIDPKDCSSIVSINQDMILGLYYATIHKNNARDTVDYYSDINLSDIRKFYTLPTYGGEYVFSNPKGHSFGVAEKIAEDIFAGMLKIHDLCYCIYDNRTYIAEAGKFIVNAILPGGLGFQASETFNCKLTDSTTNETVTKKVYKLTVNQAINKKTIGPILDRCIDYFIEYNLKEDMYGDHLADLYNRFMHTGFLMADMSSISLSLSDFEKLPVKKQIEGSLDKATKKVALLDKWFELGFCTEQEHDEAVNKIWVNTVSSCKDNIKKKFADADVNVDSISTDNFDRNSNIFMIIDSGARGDVNQLLEMAGMIGVVYNASNQQLKDPIFRSYMDGLSPMDFTSNAYTARRQIVAAQLTTADSGAQTRDLIYLAEHLHIRDDDYCCKDENKDDPYNQLLRVPCLYEAKARPDSEILWFYSADDSQEHLNIEMLVNIKDLYHVFDLCKDNLPSEFQMGMFSTDERITHVYMDTSAYYANNQIPYASFLSMINADKHIINPEVIAGISCQEYSYVIKKDANNNIVACGIRLYDLKLTRLTHDLLKYRITDTSKDKRLYNLISNNNGRNHKTYLSSHDLVSTGNDQLTDRHDILLYSDVRDGVLNEDDRILDDEAIRLLERNRIREVPIYSMLNCTSTKGICRKCYGISYDKATLPLPGSRIGYSGIQAIANPMTQLILDSHKSDYSGEESVISKIKRVTSQHHKPAPIKVHEAKTYVDGDMPFLGFVSGNKAAVAIDPIDANSYEITLFEQWNDEDESFMTKASAIMTINNLKITPSVYDGRVLSKNDKEEVIHEVIAKAGIARGTIISSIANYDHYLGCAYDASTNTSDKAALGVLASKTRFEYWESLCKCFVNDTILSRNFETFARTLTEFGVAEETITDKGIVKGYTYSISLLNAANASYTPVIEKRSAARTLAGKVYTDIAYGNPLAHMLYHAVNGTVENQDTYIGKEVLGSFGNVVTRMSDTRWNTEPQTPRKPVPKKSEVLFGQDDVKIESDSLTETVETSQTKTKTSDDFSDVRHSSIFT